MSLILGALVLVALMIPITLGVIACFAFKRLADKGSKWDKLAARYPAAGQRNVSARLVGVMLFDGVRHKRMIKVAALSEGLYMERGSLMGIGAGRPPLLVPWENLRETQDTPTFPVLVSDAWRSFEVDGVPLSVPASYLGAAE